MVSRPFLLIFIIAFCSFLKDEPKILKCHKSFTPSQLTEDLSYLVANLRKAHPDLYRVNSQSQLNKRIKSIEKKLEAGKSYLEFLKLIAPLFTDIGCANTQWAHSPDYIKFRNENVPVFPLKFKIRGEKFYISATEDDITGPIPESEVLKINNEVPSVYLEKNYALLPVDGKIKSLQVRWLEDLFPQHHSNFWEQPDTFKLVIKAGNGKTSEIAVPAQLKNKVQQKTKYNELRPTFKLSTSETAILNIPSFRRVDCSEKLLDSCFSFFADKKIKNLVLNLKGEGRGDLDFGALLYSYLVQSTFKYADEIHIKGDTSFKYLNGASYQSIEETAVHLTGETKAKNNAFAGDVYVIADGWTIHSKGLFCAKAQNRPNTFFVGEECGASPFGMNAFPILIKLPNSGIQVFIPTTQIVINRKLLSFVTGIPVNYPLGETNQDKLIEKTMGIIKSKN